MAGAGADKTKGRVLAWALAAVLVLLGLSSAAAAKPPAGLPPIAPELGNPRARVRVVIFEDLECPDCAHWHAVMKQTIFPVFAHDVRFEFRDYPLPQHPWAFNAAVVARFFATRSAKLYFAWRDYCFTHQQEITPDDLMSRAASFAAAAGVSPAALDEAFADPSLLAAVQRDQREGGTVPVEHTPTVLMGSNSPGLDADGGLRPAGLVEANSPPQLAAMLRRALGTAR